MWGSNEGRAWVSLGGVGHVELSEGLFGLTRVFLLYGFLEEKLHVHCLLCLIVVLVILSVKDPKIMLARMIKI